ncbi:uncharacterized protein LOC131597272 [Vicia villosa]|uniref:uncharacterized protein LOC131597272 n=1 Tax=Vicia villosa TaxID=3911 RepID=UPI00273B2276|nr:uncharacterized protein LOC131597272 [Vicia villosa]
MNCIDAQRVQFGNHMLEKEVEDWWGNMAQRFPEIIKYCPHYNTMNAERSKCVKFVNGLRPDIKKAIGYQQITCFMELVNKNQIYDEDSRESASHYMAMNEKECQFRGKLYDGKGKQKAGNGKKPSGGGSHTPVKCYRFGVEEHCISECPHSDATCFKCGKVGHKSHEFRSGSKVACYNYGEQGHISTKCDKSKKDQAKGKVFALSGAEVICCRT